MVKPTIPILDATLVIIEGEIRRYRIWCDQCRDYHYHGPMDGPREAHCWNPDSLYHRTGYIIVLDSGEESESAKN